MRRLLLLIPVLTLGCGDRSTLPYLGKWSGGFTVERLGKGVVGDARRNGLKGFLQLYRTGARYELHLEGEQFGLDSGGSWSQKDGQVILTPKSVKPDDRGGKESSDPNKAWIEPTDLSDAYSKPLAFRLSKDGKRLTGLLVDVGPLTGTHAFVREGSGR